MVVKKLKSLPIGKQTFANIINEGSLYVDKTKYLQPLIEEHGRYFLSRPRRFGKSLTCSTLKAIFENKKELFKDLWIGQNNYKWTKHPVIYLDFSQISHANNIELKEGLHSAVNKYAQENNIKLKEKLLKEKFAELIKKIAKVHGPVAIIVDEYDKPIVDHIKNSELAEQMRLLLKEFYEVFKGADIDANLNFLFVTGVSKFSKVSLFSGINNLVDLTMSTHADTLVGYTDSEVDYYLHDHIMSLADKHQESFDSIRSQLKKWYNGYRFTENETFVYNPFSLHNCLNEGVFKNYWFTSGTPNFLIDWIKYNQLIASQIETVEGEKIASSELEAFDIQIYHQKFKILLLQTGYLTITGYDKRSRIYSVAYPNLEVRYSMTEQILEYIGNISPVNFGNFVPKFTDALSSDNIDLFCQYLQDFFILIPHTVIVDLEKFYQGIFYMICRLFGGKPLAEVATNVGFIDILLEGFKYRYIIELKKDKKPDVALKQIEQKGYAESSKIESDKPIILVGISFKKTTKGINLAWKTKNFL